MRVKEIKITTIIDNFGVKMTSEVLEFPPTVTIQPFNKKIDLSYNDKSLLCDAVRYLLKENERVIMEQLRYQLEKGNSDVKKKVIYGNGWIDVNEKLPHGDKAVLVRLQSLRDDQYTYANIMYYNWNKGWYDFNFNGEIKHNKNFKITHWQPLPSTHIGDKE